MTTASKASSSQLRDEERLRRALTSALGGQGTLIADRIIRGEAISYAEAELVFAKVIEPNLTAAMGRQMRQVIQGAGLDLEATVINQDASECAQSYTYDLIRGVGDQPGLVTTTRDMVSRAMNAYVTTPGMTRRDLEGLLSPAFGPSRAQAIAVTEVTRAYSEATNAAQSRLQDAGIQMQRVWQTSEDELVCPRCEPLDGLPETVWGPSGPPLHTSCRCNVTLTNA